MKIASLILVSFLMVGNAQSKECKMLTSPPNHSTMKLVTADGFFMTIPKNKPKTMEPTSFVVAYKEFYTLLRNKINNECTKYKMFTGIVNLNIQHSVSKYRYNFIATYDVYE